MKDFYNEHLLLADCLLLLLSCFLTVESFYIPIESLSMPMRITLGLADFMLIIKTIIDLCNSIE